MVRFVVEFDFELRGDFIIEHIFRLRPPMSLFHITFPIIFY